MKKSISCILAIVLAVMLITSCAQAEQSSSSVATSESSTISEPPVLSEVASSSVAVSSFVSDDTSTASSSSHSCIQSSSFPVGKLGAVRLEEMESGYSFVFEDGTAYAVNFNFPIGVYYKGANIYQEKQGVVPYAILHQQDENSPLFSLKIGGAHPTDITIQQVDTTCVMIDYGDPEYEPPRDFYTLSEELADDSYYYFDDILAVTGESVVGGTGGQVIMKNTHYHLPVTENDYLVVWFFHEVDSIGAKAFFESIISNITIQKS